MIKNEYITEANNGDMIICTAGLCNLFDVDKSTLTRWTQKECPKIDKNKWNLKEVIAWYFDRLEDGSDNPESREYKERGLIAQTLYREEKAKKTAIEREQLQEQYISKDDLSREWEARIMTIKKGLDEWENDIIPKLSNRKLSELEQILEEEAHDFLMQFYQNGYYIPQAERK